MMKSILIFGVLCLMLGCRPDQAPTEYVMSAMPLIGPGKSISTPEEVPIAFSYTLDQKSLDATDDLSLMIIENPTNGKLSNCELSLDKMTYNCIYTPNKDFSGIDKVSFRAKDGDFISKTSSDVIIQVFEVPDPPVANEQIFEIPENINFDFELTRPIDPDKENTYFEIKQVSELSNGVLSGCSGNYQLNQNIACSFTSKKDFYGSEVVFYRVTDSSGESSIVNGKIVFNVRNRPEVGSDQTVSLLKNYGQQVSQEFFVSKGIDHDTAANLLQYKIVVPPKNGKLSADCFDVLKAKSEQDRRKCSYTPNDNFIGDDEFIYKINDGKFDSIKTAKVKFSVVANCSSDKRLAIFLDKNKNDLIDADEKLGEITSYSGSQSTSQNYNYYSASAHPINGPKPSGYQGNVFFYNGSDGLSLNFFFNVDNGGSTDNQVAWDIFTKGNFFADMVKVADDPGGNEFTDAGIISNSKKYIGDWHYWSNTDGGAIGPFNGKDFEIKVKMKNKGDVKDIKFYSAITSAEKILDDDIEIITSTMGANAPDTFFIKYADVTLCSDYK